MCSDCKGALPADRVLFNPDNGAPVCTNCWHKNHSMECFACKKLFEPSEVRVPCSDTPERSGRRATRLTTRQTFTVAYERRYHKDCFKVRARSGFLSAVA